MRSRGIVLWVVSFWLLVSVALLESEAVAGTHVYSIRLTGAEVVPPISTSGVALGVVQVDDTPTAEATFSVATNLAFSGLTSGATACRIYMPAAMGANGPAVVQLIVAPMSGTAGTCTGVGTVNAIHLQQILAGHAYVAIESAAFPSGEIRAQIIKRPSAVPSFPQWALFTLTAGLVAVGVAFAGRGVRNAVTVKSTAKAGAGK